MLSWKERFGFDWFKFALGPPIKLDEGDLPNRFDEIRERFGNLSSMEKIEEAEYYCAKLDEQAHSQIEKIESKSFTILGISGIGIGLISGLASFLFSLESDVVQIVMAVIFALTILSIVMTILLSYRVFRVGDYTVMYPEPSDIFQLKDASLAYVKYERTVSSFRSFVENQGISNKKATYLLGAQTWFRNSIIMLLLIALTLALYMPFSENDNNKTASLSNETGHESVYEVTNEFHNLMRQLNDSNVRVSLPVER